MKNSTGNLQTIKGKRQLKVVPFDKIQKMCDKIKKDQQKIIAPLLKLEEQGDLNSR